jgi:hypothetical protein
MRDEREWDISGKITEKRREPDENPLWSVVGGLVILFLIGAMIRGCANSHGAVVTTPPAVVSQGR